MNANNELGTPMLDPISDLTLDDEERLAARTCSVIGFLLVWEGGYLVGIKTGVRGREEAGGGATGDGKEKSAARIGSINGFFGIGGA